MSSVIEKNDVDIRPLFSWKKDFTVKSKGEDVPVYMRVVGDADINKARVAALRRSADLRRRLKDLDSDERVAYIRPLDEVTKDSMISVIIVFAMRELADLAKREVKIKLPKAPKSDAKTELHEKYQQEIDDYPEKHRKEVRKFLEKQVEIRKKDLELLPIEKLYDKYVANMIDELCERELLKAFREWTAYLSAYKDEQLKEKFFESFDEFSNLPSDLKDQFISEYSILEMSMDDLKKLQPVTQ